MGQRLAEMEQVAAQVRGAWPAGSCRYLGGGLSAGLGDRRGRAEEPGQGERAPTRVGQDVARGLGPEPGELAAWQALEGEAGGIGGTGHLAGARLAQHSSLLELG